MTTTFTIVCLMQNIFIQRGDSIKKNVKITENGANFVKRNIHTESMYRIYQFFDFMFTFNISLPFLTLFKQNYRLLPLFLQ